MTDYVLPDINTSIGRNIEFDVYLPKLNLAFEYQGIQHYRKHSFLRDVQYMQETDEAKKRACNELKITLIPIPYWWDYKVDSLKATIHQHRPDLISTDDAYGNPIPISLPDQYPKATKGRFTVTILIRKGRAYQSQLLLAEKWDDSINPTGWYSFNLLF